MQNHVLDYLEHTARNKPDKAAFVDEHEALTFGQLRRFTRSIGSFLHGKGICRQPVVVFMGKSAREIAAFFGVIAGGCFYVPVDEEMPEGRIRLILENTQPAIVICDKSTEAKARSIAGELETVLFDAICDTPVHEAALKEIYERTIDTDPLYIVFTSGSTGIPKGVAACHRSVLDYTEQLSQVLAIDENTVFGNQAPLYMDACLKELYPTLKFGATTYLIPRELFLFPVKLVEYINANKINTLCWVPSALTIISALGTFRTVKPGYLRTVAFGGEAFPVRQLNRWREALPDTSFINLYGPTEGTGMCCYYKVERDFSPDESIPIGKPFHNTDILLLTDDNRRAAPGETGEICIRGTSLTLGYYNDFARTSRVFVQNPLNTAYPELIYRTGDLARVNDRGELVFISRRDRQIKHMGHRVELGEIETCAGMLPGAGLVACVYDSDKGRILLFYTGELRESQLMAGLKDKLPRYMLPNRVFRLAEMPFTPNGKLDRQALLKLYL